MSCFVRWVLVATFLVGTAATGTAQSANQQTPQQNPDGGYTLHANAHEVVTDVTVTDSKGNPIHGLRESAFHIFDNGKPQRVGNFEEHTAQDASMPSEESTAANVYSNDVVLHPPRVFNIILVDAISIGIVDQMYLRQELDHFIEKLPPDEPFAIFARNSEHVVMLANFTADHQKLTKAINYELPRLISGVGLIDPDISLMEEICTYLEQYPGRKNVLWFRSGAAPIMGLTTDPSAVAGYIDLRPLYDALEKARVALYPIDTRGLQVNGSIAEEFLLEDEADATGGHAVFNANDLAAATKHIADSDSSFYTLTYSPKDVKFDNSWHKVKVMLDGAHYVLSYRHGYYDDGSNMKQPEAGTPRKRLLENGESVSEVPLAAPIVFKVSITPVDPAAQEAQHPMLHASAAPPKKGERAYMLHYAVPMDAFTMQSSEGNDHVSLGLAVFAFNKFGRPVTRVNETVTLGVKQELVAASGPSPRISFDQEINLPDGQDFLYIGVWNNATGRLGTVQIPFVVDK